MPSLPNRLASLLSSLTPNQIRAMSGLDRELLYRECLRVLRACEQEKRLAELNQTGTTVKSGVDARFRVGNKTGVLKELKARNSE